MGSGVITTDANGDALIQNLAPGKYGVSVVPPSGQGWIQTSTIEGTKINDAWVKPDEPPFFVEFGPPGVHAFFGFVQPMKDAILLHRHGHHHRTGSVAAQRPAAGLHLLAGRSGARGLGRAEQRPGRNRTGGLCTLPPTRTATSRSAIFPRVSTSWWTWDENLDVIFDARNVTVAAGATYT